jgi:hypothetical protein
MWDRVMAIPDLPESAPIWQQFGYGMVVAGLGLIYIIRQIWAGKKDAAEAPKTLQAFELTDTSALVKKLDLLLEQRTDIEEMRRSSDVIRDMLAKIDRRLEIDAVLREDRAHRGRSRTE